MGKIVKYCTACEESFAEKFGFCPNCGQPMNAFEMNPLLHELKNSVPETNHLETEAPVSDFYETTPKIEEPAVSVVEEPKVSEAAEYSAFETQPFFDEEVAIKAKELEVSDIDDEVVEEEEIPALASTAAAGSNFNNYEVPSTNYAYQTPKHFQSDDAYRVTVIEEKNVKQRNLLLLGAFVLMTSLALGGTIYSLFNHNLLVGAINEDLRALVPVIDEVPMDVEEPVKKDKDKGGGGGGGGREEETETSKGRLATQTEKPQIRPDVSIVQLTNPTIPIIASTQGKKEIKPTDEKYGNPNASLSNILSNGTGTGGGQGKGNGDGQGTGRGSGAGSGNGSGFGGGDGDGDGNGKGDGDGNGRNATIKPPPPPPPTGVTEGLKITSKPTPPFTDTARTQQIQGVVRLRVTFLSSGQIGAISTVQGLSGGLTDNAIAAARRIQFQPAKKNGVPQTIIKQIDYTFTLY